MSNNENNNDNVNTSQISENNLNNSNHSNNNDSNNEEPLEKAKSNNNANKNKLQEETKTTLEELKINIKYKDISKFILIDPDDVLYQLKLLVCAKFKIFNVDSIVLHKLSYSSSNNDNSNNEDNDDSFTHIPLNFNDDEKIGDFLNNNDIIICEIKSQEPKNSSSNVNNNSSVENNINNKEQPSNDTNHNNMPNNNINTRNNNNTINNITQETNNTNILQTNRNTNKKSNNNINNNNNNNAHNNYHLVAVCACKKDDASNVCLKCNITMCEACKKKDHYLHLQETIKVSKFKDFLEQKVTNAKEKLNEKIIDDETYIYLHNFDFNFKLDLERIDKSYQVMHSLLEELKELEINYMIEMNKQMAFNSKFDEVKDKVEELNKYYSIKLGEEVSLDNDDNDNNEESNNSEDGNNKINQLDKRRLTQLTPLELIHEKVNCDVQVESSLNKYKFLCSLFQIYISAITTIETLNSDMLGNIKEVLLQAQGPFNIPNLNLQIQKFLKSGLNKKNKYFNDQVIMRFLAYNQILSFKPKSYIQYVKKLSKTNNTNETINNNNINTEAPPKLRKIKIPENENFKLHFQNSDEIELNIDNKLFIITGKKSNVFFCYDYTKNEITQLEDLKSSHQYGGLFYCPENNSLYCLGGINSKKCEIYRNDELIYPANLKNSYKHNMESNLYNNNNFNNYNRPKHYSWVVAPEMNVYRQEFAGIIFNNYLYIFFGYNNLTCVNNNTIERLNVSKNDKWEVMAFANPSNLNISLSGHGAFKKSETEILIFGGFDGRNYKDSIILFNVSNFSFFATNCKIPSLKKYGFFQFFKQSCFLDTDLSEVNVNSNGVEETNSSKKEKESKDSKVYDFFNFDSRDLLHFVNIRKFRYEIIDDFRKSDDKM